MPAAPSVPCTMNIHYRQAAARSSCNFGVVYDLSSQPRRPGDLDLLTLKVVSESRMTMATSLPILVFLGLSVLQLGQMYATDVRQKHRLMPPPTRGRGITIESN